MAEHGTNWPKQGPADTFHRSRRNMAVSSIAEWQYMIATCGDDKHMDIVN